MRLLFPVWLWLSISIRLNHGRHSDVEDDQSPVHGPEHALYRHIVEHYKPDSRPVKNASDAVVVTFALSLNQLLDLDEKNQVLSTSVWIYEEWKDELLVWSAEDFHNQKTLMIPASSIWLPDIFIFNAAGDTADGFIHVNGSKVAIQNNGEVGWMVPLMVNSACAVDVTYFPYDRQTCTIKFGSWIYDINQLDIVLDASKPDLDHYVMNSEYDLENVSLTRGILDSSCCAGDGRHSMIELQIKLKRKSLFYDYIVIAPTIMLCVLTLASFLLPCDKGEKIAIGLTVFLTLYVLQLRIADNVPDTNSTPILGVFMLVVMTFNCVSLIMATVVMNIKKRGDISQCLEVPTWLFTLCEKALGPIVCTLWKAAIPIPLSLLEVVVEHETTFDGPEVSLKDKSKLVEDTHNTSWREAENPQCEEIGKENSEIFNSTATDDREMDTEFHSGILSERHVQFDTSSTRGKHAASKTSQLYRQDRLLSETDTDLENESCHVEKDEQEIRELKAKFKTHHPSLRHSVTSKRRKRRRMPSEQLEGGFPKNMEAQTDIGNASLGAEDQELDSISLPHSTLLDTSDGIRQRKRNVQSESSESLDKSGDEPSDEQNVRETDSFLPWSPSDVPALEQARRMNLRKRQWFYVAEVVDKFAFFVYLVLLTVSIFTVLFLIPVTFRKSNA